MFTSTTFAALLLSASVAMASSHQPHARNHNRIARAVNTTQTFDKRSTYNGVEMTWYPTDTGPDACTGKNHQDSDFFVAMGYDQFDAGGCCGKQMTITYNGKSAVATCVDECASCPQWGQLDLTKGLFEYFNDGNLDVGVFYGSWSYVGEGDDTTTTTKPTTTHAATTPKPTTPKPTTHTTPTTTSTKEDPTTTSKAVEKVEVKTTSTKHSSSSEHSSSAKPSSSSAKPSSSSAKPSSSSAKPSSSSAKPSSSSASASPSASDTESVAVQSAVGNVEGAAGSAASTTGVSVAGALTGSGNGASTGASPLPFLAAAAAALVGVLAL